MTVPRQLPPRRCRPGFSLTEVLVVMVVIGLLVAAGLTLFGSGGRAQRTAIDALSGMVDRARSTAVTSQREVLLVVAAPDEVPGGDGRLRLGLFELDGPPDGGDGVDGRQLGRWQPLPRGVVLVGGEVDGQRNLLDEGKLTLRYTAGGRQVEAQVHALGFHPRGGLRWPAGSDPLVLRVGEGSYVDGVPRLTTRAGESSAEAIRVGRVTARPWRVGA